LILHLERGRLATPIDHYIDRQRREHPVREELNTTNSYNQQLKNNHSNNKNNQNNCKKETHAEETLKFGRFSFNETV